MSKMSAPARAPSPVPASSRLYTVLLVITYITSNHVIYYLGIADHIGLTTPVEITLMCRGDCGYYFINKQTRRYVDLLIFNASHLVLPHFLSIFDTCSMLVVKD